MTEWTVLSDFCAFAQPDAAQRAAVLPLCRASLERLRRVLQKDADPEDPRISRAAAADAFYDWTTRTLAREESVTSFKAGDVTISRSASAARELAAQVRRDAYLAVLPLLEDPYFVFQTI